MSNQSIFEDDIDGNSSLCQECCNGFGEHFKHCSQFEPPKEELEYMQKCEDFRDNLALEYAKIALNINTKFDHSSVAINAYRFADAMISAKLSNQNEC